jgi:hypothetical protein
MATIDAQILNVSENVSKNIDVLGGDRSLLAQNILAQLRNLVEAIAVRLHLSNGMAEFHYDATGPAIDWIGSQNKEINFLHRFHKLLQMSTSHYTLEGDASERLMLKYYEYLLRTRKLLHEQCGLDVLDNLEKFPVDLDPSLRSITTRLLNG